MPFLICPQVPLFIPVVFCLTCFFMVFLSLYSDPVNTGIGFSISLTGFPVYYALVYFNRRPKWLQRALGMLQYRGTSHSNAHKPIVVLVVLAAIYESIYIF